MFASRLAFDTVLSRSRTLPSGRFISTNFVSESARLYEVNKNPVTIKLTDTVFYLEHPVLVLFRHKTDSYTTSSGTRCSTDPVNVLLRLVRHIPVDYHCNIFNVQPTSPNVCGN